MNKFLITFFICFITLTCSMTESRSQEFITINFPEAVITKAISAILPLNIDTNSRTIQGDITIIDISELQLVDQHLICRLHLAGNNLALVTEIAGHDIRLKVGSVKVDFKTNSAVRFDREQQTLYIKPVVENAKDDSNTDIGQALVALLNGREFPISMKKLNPMIAETGSKTLTINTSIANIEAQPKAIQLSLIPKITTNTKTKK